MGLTYSTDTDVVTIGVGLDVTYQIQEFVASGTPTWQRKNLLRRVWANKEDQLPDNTNKLSTFYNFLSLGAVNQGYDVSTIWTYDDDNPARAYSGFYQPHMPIIGVPARVTLLDYSIGINSNFGSAANVLAGRDRSNVLQYANNNVSSRDFTGTGDSVGTFYDGANGFLVDATSATLLDDWYYPTPSHMKLFGTSGAYVMSNVAPTSARAYMQPFLRDTPLEAFSQRMGIGGYQNNDGQRLIQSLGINDAFWIRPGAPIRPLLRWGFASNNDGPSGGSINNAVYGLPPIEISGCGMYFPTIGGFPITSVKVYLELSEYKYNAISATVSIIASLDIPFSATSGGFDQYVLQPTDSGHSTTLHADTVAWAVRVYVLATRPPFPDEGGQAFYWHKSPCHVQPYAMSNVVDGVSQYLPGWLYDPLA